MNQKEFKIKLKKKGILKNQIVKKFVNQKKLYKIIKKKKNKSTNINNI